MDVQQEMFLNGGGKQKNKFINMKELNTYINEKLKINKELAGVTVDEIVDKTNKKFINALTNYLKNKYNIKVNEEWHTKVYVGDSKKYIVITLKYRKEIYKSIMKYIDTNYPISKPCATNNQSIYVYPDYD